MEKYKITAIICALALTFNSLGTYTDNADAAPLPVTADDASLSAEIMERGSVKSADANTDVQQLQSGEKVQGRLVSGTDVQQYQITLKSSGQLDIQLEGDVQNLSGRLTDKSGKGWAPRKSGTDGKRTYQLNQGTYYYQIQAGEGAEISEPGLDYAVTAKFKSAKAKFENNTTRKKSAKLPFKKVFYGHLAQNASTEYYKFTLDKQSYFSFSLTTQITDYTPETFVVTLYNKYGKPMSKWENPDWVEQLKFFEYEYTFLSGNWYRDEHDNCDGGYESYDRGATWVLPAGDYYIGVSVKRDKDGKVPAAARYGQYAAFAASWSPFVSVELSHKQAEYTGKKIKLPKVTIRDLGYAWLERYSLHSHRYKVYGLTAGVGDTPKRIGRYMIEQDMWYVNPEFYNEDTFAYDIFTVTPIRGKISRVSSKKQREIQVSVKKNAQSTGYQIQIARDKNFKKSKKTLKTTNIKETIKGLSSGKKYYVRVRNYKDVETYYSYMKAKYLGIDGDILVPETIYGKWSKTKTVVCK